MSKIKKKSVIKEKFSKEFFFLGLFFLVSGFILMGFAGRMADNAAGVISPFLLLAGWILIAYGLWKNE